MKQILFIEDDELFARMNKLKLEGAGYQVTVAPSANDALDQLETNPDVVVLDVLLPDKNGLWFLKELRRLGYDMPVVLLSNLSETDFAMPPALRETLGVASYLVKTKTTPAELVARVHLAERR